MAEWGELEEDWDTVERIEGDGRGELGEPGRDLKKDAEIGNPGVLGDVEVLAAEIAESKRLLAMMLYLSTGAKPAKDIVSLKVYEARKVRVKKKVRVPSKSPYKPDKIVEKEVEEERWDYYRLPPSTAYRVLKRLRELGLVEAYRGVDYRKRYYKLTELGRKVADKLREILQDYLKRNAERKEGKHVLEEHRIEKLAKRIGVEPSLLVRSLGLRKVEVGYSEYYAVPKTI